MGNDKKRKRKTSTSGSKTAMALKTRRKEICKFFVDMLLFYTTSFFVLLATFSLFALIFLVPFFIDPAWSTLQADFDPNQKICTTKSGVYHEGKSNCEWSSCEEGCTKTVFTCWQILVDVHEEGGRLIKSNIRLYPNVKGCGYPPRINCTQFIDAYSVNGSSYPCFYSRKKIHSSEKNFDLAIPNLDLNQIWMDLFYCLAIPVPCFLISIIYLFIAYFCIYSESQSQSIRNGTSIRVNGSSSAMSSGSANKYHKHSATDRRRKDGGSFYLPVVGSTGSRNCESPDSLERLREYRDDEDEFDNNDVVGNRSSSNLHLNPGAQNGSNEHSSMRFKYGGPSSTDGSSIGKTTEDVIDNDIKKRLENIPSPHKRMIEYDRIQYSQEKYTVMQYYQYYGI